MENSRWWCLFLFSCFFFFSSLKTKANRSLFERFINCVCLFVYFQILVFSLASVDRKRKRKLLSIRNWRYDVVDERVKEKNTKLELPNNKHQPKYRYSKEKFPSNEKERKKEQCKIDNNHWRKREREKGNTYKRVSHQHCMKRQR